MPRRRRRERLSRGLDLSDRPAAYPPGAHLLGHRHRGERTAGAAGGEPCSDGVVRAAVAHRSEEHTSELQSLMRISYAVFCLKKKKQQTRHLKQRTKNE